MAFASLRDTRFDFRMQLVKKKYNNQDEAYQAITGLLQKLDDPYTRFLPPAKYQSLVNSATGEVRLRSLP